LTRGSPSSSKVRQRLDAFEASRQAELGCHGGADFRAGDPKFNSTSRVRASTAGT